jgi:hypothetical protein
MNEQFIFEAQPLKFYSGFGFEQEVDLDQFTPFLPLLTAWRTVEKRGGVYALYKGKVLKYIGEATTLGGAANRLYLYQWYGSKLACNIHLYYVRYIYISDKGERSRVEQQLRAKYKEILTNVYELEA